MFWPTNAGIPRSSPLGACVLTTHLATSLSGHHIGRPIETRDGKLRKYCVNIPGHWDFNFQKYIRLEIVC